MATFGGISVTIGGQPAQVQSAAGAVGDVQGVTRIDVVIPAGIQAGTAVPVTITVGNMPGPEGVTVSVAGS